MRIDGYLQHIPEIEARIRALQPDAIVLGVGPSAWLLPWIDQSLIAGVRRFGVHDVFRLMAVDDLIVMDPPVKDLHPDNERHQIVCGSRPRRIWVHDPQWTTDAKAEAAGVRMWDRCLPDCLKPIVRTVRWQAFHPRDQGIRKDMFRLSVDPPQTMAMSPIGGMTLAWREGCRRIGVIGMDCLPNHHHTHGFHPSVNLFCKILARQAREQGGTLAQLSPFSVIDRLDNPCRQPIAGSLATAISA